MWLMRMIINMQSLSLYRTELMGLAAILIIVCHSTQGPCPIDSVGVLHKLVVAGNYGVDIFLLLSGVGLCYSLEHLYEGEGGLKRWYKRRFIRIMVPYFILVVPWWGIVCIMEGVEFRTFLWRVSTMSYWTNHDGVWFLSMLLPLYLFTPFYGWLVKKSAWHQSCLPAIFILAIICFGPRAYELQPLDKTSVFANISFCLVRLPSFFVGYWAASYVKKGTEIPIWLAIVIPLVGIVIAHYYYNRLVSLQHLFSSLLIVSIAICLFKCLCVGGGENFYSLWELFHWSHT